MTLDPGTLSDLALWLRAKDLTQEDGALVPNWPDHSGRNNHGVVSATVNGYDAAFPTVVDNATPNGERAVQFSGGGKFDLGPVLSGGSYLEPLVRAKSAYDLESYAPGNALPGTAGFWITAQGKATPTWWQMRLSIAKTIRTYAITADDSTPSRTPSTFKFMARNQPTVIAATASSADSDAWPPIRAFVPPVSDWRGWQTVANSGAAGAWVAAELSAPYAATGYDMEVAYGNTSAMPTAWRFEGSNDGVIWTTLDSQTAQNFSDGATKKFAFVNTTAYSRYRLYSLSNGGATFSSWSMVIGTPWVVLDTQTGLSWANPGQQKIFTFANNTAFNTYQLDITANGGDAGFTSIGEFNAGEVAIGDLVLQDPGCEAWVVVKETQTLYQPNGLWQWSSNDQSVSAYPNTPGDSFGVYESFCTNTYVGQYYYVDDVMLQDTWHVYRTSFRGGVLAFDLDGVEQKSTGNYALPKKAPNVWLGESWYSSSRYPFVGQIAEVLARTKLSSDTEARDIFAYFKAKYINLTASGISPVSVKSRYPVGVVPETKGTSPATSSSLDFSIFTTSAYGMAPVDAHAETLFVAELSGWVDEDTEIFVTTELSGDLDPILPEPVPPEDLDELPDPTEAPTLTKSASTVGCLPAGTYRYSYAAWRGSSDQATAPSPMAEITLDGEDTVTITYPTIDGADGYLVYREDPEDFYVD